MQARVVTCPRSSGAAQERCSRGSTVVREEADVPWDWLFVRSGTVRHGGIGPAAKMQMSVTSNVGPLTLHTAACADRLQFGVQRDRPEGA